MQTLGFARNLAALNVKRLLVRYRHFNLVRCCSTCRPPTDTPVASSLARYFSCRDRLSMFLLRRLARAGDHFGETLV